MKSIRVRTSQKREIIDVTDQLEALLGDMHDGLAYFSTPHTTAALIVNEDDAELRLDLIKTAERLLEDLRPFNHGRSSNPNAEAHIFSALAGSSLVLAVEDGRLDLGQWQRVLLLELDGPKTREIRCKLISG